MLWIELQRLSMYKKIRLSFASRVLAQLYTRSAHSRGFCQEYARTFYHVHEPLEYSKTHSTGVTLSTYKVKVLETIRVKIPDTYYRKRKELNLFLL